MNDLSPEARALLELASGEDSPNTEDRVRVRQALAASLAAGAVSSSATAAAASKSALTAAGAAKSTVGIWLTVGVVAGLAGSAAIYVSKSDTPSAASAPKRDAVKTRAVAPLQAPGPEIPATPPAAPEVPAAPPARPPITRTAPSAGKGSVAAHLPVNDVSHAAAPLPPPAPPPPTISQPATIASLAPETALLESARTALGRGDAPGALALLERHEREFPTGALLEERLAAKVFALCSLGRREEAARAATRLLRVSPASPLRARILDSCAYEH
jgi:hypothetical protein